MYISFVYNSTKIRFPFLSYAAVSLSIQQGLRFDKNDASRLQKNVTNVVTVPVGMTRLSVTAHTAAVSADVAVTD